MEFFGINPAEALVLTVIVALVLGPRQLVSLFRKIQNLRGEIAAFSAAARARFLAETEGPGKTVQEISSEIKQLSQETPIDLAQMVNPKEYIRQQVAAEMNQWLQALTAEVTDPPTSGQPEANPPNTPNPNPNTGREREQ